MPKIQIDLKMLEYIFPEASLIPNLPRKKKKAMKIKISKELLVLAMGTAIEIIKEHENKKL
jgi:hypothetical protein